MEGSQPVDLVRPYKHTGWRLYLKTVVARAYPRIIGQQREKSWMFFDILLPMLSVSAYVFVYRAIGAPEDYIGFVVVGGAMIAFWMNVLWSMSSQLYWEKEQGNLALFIMSPSSLMAILLGMALGGLVATTLRALAIILLGSAFFSVDYAVSSFSQLFIVFTHTMVALYGLGMMAASFISSYPRPGTSQPCPGTNLLPGRLYFPIKNFSFGSPQLLLTRLPWDWMPSASSSSRRVLPWVSYPSPSKS
jgi:ABC-2 type transport system permease protein